MPGTRTDPPTPPSAEPTEAEGDQHPAWWSEPVTAPAPPVHEGTMWQTSARFPLPAAGAGVGESGHVRGSLPTGALPLIAVAIVSAIIGGGIGGAAGVLSERSANHNERTVVTDPSASLGTGGTIAPLNRPAGSVAAIAAKLVPSVVTIQVQGTTSTGTGSGVVVRSDGYILTNNHVVEMASGGDAVVVQFANGRDGVPARIVGRDPSSDLAVIKVAGSQYRPAALGRSASLVVGDPVLAIGAPLGLSSTVTSGIVSALNRTVFVPSDGGGKPHVISGAIQTDAAINPGNSGGALVDGLGQVIGINTAIASISGLDSGQSGNIGVGFAIPIDFARSVAEEIIRTGHATHPFLGVALDTVTESAARANGLVRGAIITAIAAGSPAATGGLKVRDIVTKVDDTIVDSADTLVLALRGRHPGEAVHIFYWRGGRAGSVTITLVATPG